MTEELKELEPFDESAPVVGATGAEHMAASGGRGTAILGAPAFNPAADKEYYRFVFAGVVMFLGCMMPWGPEWEMAGYKTLSGAFFTLIAIGMIWSWWGAIATGRFGGANLKWVGLSLVPLIVTLFNLISAFDAPAVQDMIAQGKPMPDGWGGFFSQLGDSMPFIGGDKAPAASERVGNFLRGFGGGQIVLFFGAVYAEFAMLLAIMGGAKAAKEQKARAAAGGRRRR